MAFSKLYQVVPDGAIGFQTLNQAGLNNDEMHAQMAVEHGTNEMPPSQTVIDYAKLGRHNLTEIPRTVASTSLYIAPNLTIQSSLSWTGLGLSNLWRWSTGLYLLHVVGLSTFWATAEVFATAGVTYLAPQVRPFYASATNGSNSGLWVSTFNLVAGDFVPVDAAFSLALYGQP